MKKLTYGERALCVDHPVTKKLLLCMEEKKTNLGIAADVTSKKSLFDLVHQVGPYICVLKTHMDILSDFESNVAIELQKLATEYQFLIFEDRKFADIGQTVQQQYEGGLYRISDWADLVNAHILPGPGIIEGLKSVGMNKGRGLLLLAQMSSAGNLLTETYTEQALHLAEEHSDFVVGFIAQTKLTKDPKFLHLTPGVQFKEKGDALGQQYVTPEKAILEGQTDIILVGRGIYQARFPCEEAMKYQQCGWSAYLRMFA